MDTEQWLIAAFNQIDNKLNRLLQTMTFQEHIIVATLQDIQDSVGRETDVSSSVVTLLQQISAQLKAAIAANDPVLLQSIVTQIDANSATLAQAVTDNTPAA